MAVRTTIRSIHRYLSLTVAVFWILQALTGALSVWHRELDAALLDAPDTPLNITALGESIDSLVAARPDSHFSSLYAVGGAPNQFDLYVTDQNDAENVIRLDGEGHVLRERPWARDYSQTDLIHTARMFHETFLGGERGLIIVGISGLLLLTNIILGFKLAWPRAGQWLRALRPKKVRPVAAYVYSWHRAAGLWLGVPAIVIVTAGVLQVWRGDIAELLNADPSPPDATAATATGAATLSSAQAMEIAMARYPQAMLSVLSLPSEDRPWYRVRLLQPSEMRRVYGMTAIYISSRTGVVLADYDASKRKGSTRFVDSFFPIHTGEFLGLTGRLIGFVTGLWLAVTVSLGVSLWWMRTRRART